MENIMGQWDSVPQLETVYTDAPISNGFYMFDVKKLAVIEESIYGMTVGVVPGHPWLLLHWRIP
jgi:hypothetical protein